MTNKSNVKGRNKISKDFPRKPRKFARFRTTESTNKPMPVLNVIPDHILLSRKIGAISRFLENICFGYDDGTDEFAVKTINEFLSENPDRNSHEQALNNLKIQFYKSTQSPRL